MRSMKRPSAGMNKGGDPALKGTGRGMVAQVRGGLPIPVPNDVALAPTPMPMKPMKAAPKPNVIQTPGLGAGGGNVNPPMKTTYGPAQRKRGDAAWRGPNAPKMAPKGGKR